MSTPAIFDYAGHEVRTVLIDGEPWFIAADALAILDLNRSSVALLDADEKGVHSVDTQGGWQKVGVVSEPGVYSLILRSRKPEAKAFKRWLVHEVLPAIRQTGSYGGPQFEIPQTYAAALRVAADAHDARELAEARVAELQPSADAWDHLASTAAGDYSVNEAAKIISRDPVLLIGEGRLWKLLDAWRWTYRDASGDRRAYQAQVDAGRLAGRARSHHNPRSGELVVDAPQVRVSAKGLADIRRKMLGKNLVVVAS